ncbi:MAG: hypothetical protein ACKOPN_11270 [Prochlorococcaceae cyanobacterium]|jgi:hypothetical protein
MIVVRSLAAALAGGCGLLLLAGGGAFAQSGALMPRADRLTPEQQQKLLPELRRLALADYGKRTALLDQARRCVSAARTFPEYNDCRKQERQAYGQWRRQQQDETRRLYERNGITLPERNQRQPKGGPQG